MNRISVAPINWESEAVLSQIADKIHKPLAEIIRLTRYIQTKSRQEDVETNRLSTIMLESSEQLETLVQDIIRMEQQQRIQVVVHNKLKYPELYTFDTNNSTAASKHLAESSIGGESKRVSKADLAWLIELETKVQEHLSSSMLCVPWLAAELAVSERQLFRKVDRYTGLTPNNYIRKIRMWKAKQLLESYACTTVNEVAATVGVKDPYYFSKLFVEEFGVKPKLYLN